MRGALALGAEIAGGGDDSTPHVPLPEAVHDNPRKERACSGFGVCDPISERAAAVGGVPAVWRLGLPAALAVRPGHQNLQEALGGDRLLEVGVAALEEVGLLQE